MEHERMHVANRDFLFKVLAHLHRAIFWFNPLAWWLPRELSSVSEQLSDDAAIRAVGDRTAYAAILLEVAGKSRPLPAAVAMARESSVTTRIERILSEHELAKRPSLKRRMLLAAPLLPVIMGIAGCSTDKSEPAQSTASPLASPPSEVTSGKPPLVASTQLPKSNPAYPLSQPKYPGEARRAKQQGTVVMELFVLEDGRVGDARVKKSSNYPPLDEAAVAESRNWRLDPGTIEGKPEPMWGKFAVTFKLSD
jgi:TonB family protein